MLSIDRKTFLSVEDSSEQYVLKTCFFAEVI